VVWRPGASGVGHDAPVRDPRPALTPAIERLLDAIVVVADLDVDVGAIVVAAAAAHGTASASVRDLAGCASSVVVAGRARSVELALRPPFFLDGDAPTRLTTLVDELLHLQGRGLRARTGTPSDPMRSSKKKPAA